MRDKRIETLELDPDIFVTLKPGYQLDGSHSFGEYELGDVRKTMKRVKVCTCEECKQ